MGNGRLTGLFECGAFQIHLFDVALTGGASSAGPNGDAAPSPTHGAAVGLPKKVGESSRIRPGLRINNPVSTEIGKIGLEICYDIRYEFLPLSSFLTSRTELLFLSASSQVPRASHGLDAKGRSDHFHPRRLHSQDWPGSLVHSRASHGHPVPGLRLRFRSSVSLMSCFPSLLFVAFWRGPPFFLSSLSFVQRPPQRHPFLLG